MLLPLDGALTCVDSPIIRGCGGRNEIFQVCGPGGSADSVSRFPLHDVVQDEAVEDLLADHELPAADKARVFGFARDDVRAGIYAQLLEMAAKADAARTANEQAIVDFYAGWIRDTRIDAAQTSVNEYNIWAGNKCSYVPPEGFSYTPDPGPCSAAGGGLGGVFDPGPPPPSLEDFQAYGAAAAYAAFDDPAAARVASAAARSLELKIGLGVAGAVAAGAIVGAAVKLAAIAIFPYAIKAGMLAAVGSAAAVGAAMIVVLAVIIAVVQGIAVFTEAEIPGKLNQALAQAEAPAPDLRQLITKADGSRELYLAFIETTLPDFPSQEAPPARVAADPLFAITDQSGGGRVVRPYIDFFTWDDSDWRARLSGGWFVAETEDTDDGQPFATLTLKIAYVGWNDEEWTAWRLGEDFLHTKEGDTEASFISQDIRFLDVSGTPRIATITADDTPPTITPNVSGTAGDNGWYVSNVGVSWSVVDPESEILSRSNCDPAQITTDGTTALTCSAESPGGAGTGGVTVKRDATPPNIDGSASPAPNEWGWHKADVEVSFACADPTSGIASCTPASTITAEGTGHEATGTATDNAGNTASTTVGGIKIDRTPPTITGSASPPPNAAGWNNTDVFIAFACGDGLSGLVPIEGCTFSADLTTEGADQSRTGTARDLAGNSSSTAVEGVSIDRTAPAVVLTVPADGATFVQNELVPATWSAIDALSGVASATGSAASGGPIDTSTAGTLGFTVTAADVADNVTTVTHGYTVLSAAEATEALVAEVRGLGLRPPGIENSLLASLENGRQSLGRGNAAVAQGQLQAFINQVNAQRGKRIAEADADALIAYATLILGALPPSS